MMAGREKSILEINLIFNYLFLYGALGDIIPAVFPLCSTLVFHLWGIRRPCGIVYEYFSYIYHWVPELRIGILFMIFS